MSFQPKTKKSVFPTTFELQSSIWFYPIDSKLNNSFLSYFSFLLFFCIYFERCAYLNMRSLICNVWLLCSWKRIDVWYWNYLLKSNTLFICLFVSLFILIIKYRTKYKSTNLYIENPRWGSIGKLFDLLSKMKVLKMRTANGSLTLVFLFS